eukprot:NODE_789_length_3873_cov_0.228405.p2 type:complete len:204 gc:universal NODE_789_length_3873_cov_0.228405:3026-2415(-)
MPPIPGIPPIGGPLDSGLGASTIKHSEVANNEATPLASCSAVLVTFNGSTIPLLIISTYSPLAASYPISNWSISNNLPTTYSPFASVPALLTIVVAGARNALLTISTPNCWSNTVNFKLSKILDAFNNAVPPPGKIPSSTAAFVAFNASTYLSFFSPTSTSLDPPTLMTATPPLNLANLSCNFSFSYSEVVSSICDLICSHLP